MFIPGGLSVDTHTDSSKIIKTKHLKLIAPQFSKLLIHFPRRRDVVLPLAPAPELLIEIPPDFSENIICVCRYVNFETAHQTASLLPAVSIGFTKSCVKCKGNPGKVLLLFAFSQFFASFAFPSNLPRHCFSVVSCFASISTQTQFHRGSP